MPVSIPVLKKHGISSGEYKKIFCSEDKPARVEKLIDTLRNRIKDGYMSNFRDSRVFFAIDAAYDAPFAAIAPTLMNSLLSRNLKPDEIYGELEKYGLRESDLFIDGVTSEGQKGKVLNPPILWAIILPLVRSYCTIRVASLFNERNKSPLLPYRPLKKTSRNRVICEIVTDTVQTIATWYGYPNYLEQAIKQMIKYGIALSFPQEEWHCEEQLQMVDGQEKKVVEREGIRYLFPHPTRMFYDLYSPLTTINSNSGVRFAGHWQVVPYSDVLDNNMYWNRRCISYGTNWFQNPIAGNYFSEFYPCRLQFPVISPGAETLREDRAAFYSSEDRDKAVFLTHVFMELNPKTWGLGRYKEIDGKDKLVDTYDFPVWHHFVLAGDSTVIWAEPSAYHPTWGMMYDYDPQASRQTSLGLETMPWQDHMSNVLSQMMLTAKQNLANVIFYDTNMVDAEDIKRLDNLGERKFRGMNFIGYDSLKTTRGGFDPKQAFVPVQLNYRTIQDMVQMMGSILDIMERVLQFTAQEVGSTAKHYQSAEEIKTVTQSSDTRSQYTGASIDNAIDAWKRQIYQASMAYRDDEVEAQVSSDIPDVEQVLEDLGFKVTDRMKDKLMVKGPKKKLQLDEFAKSGEGQEPDTDPQVATIMLQTIGMIAKQPVLFQAIGVKKILSLLEQAAKIAGADKDFKLPPDPSAQQPPAGQPPGSQPPSGPPPAGAPPTGQTGQPMQQPGQPPQPNPALMQQLAPLLQQFQQTITQMIEQKVVVPAAQEMAKLQQQITQIEQVLAKVVHPTGALQTPPSAPNLNVPPPPGPAGAPPVAPPVAAPA